MEYKIVLGVIAVVIALVAYVPYIKDLLSGKTNPHVFSWFLWALMEAIAFFAQISKGAGAGAWVIGAGFLLAFFVGCVALTREDKQITRLDWIALAGAVLGIILWVISKNPLLAIIFVSVADALAFIPTFRKTYYKPNEETLIEYALSAVKHVVGILALQAYNLTTWLYPASLIITNAAFVIMALIRRKQITKTN